MSGRIVITGAGMIGGFGSGWHALAAALDAGHPVLAEAERHPLAHRRASSSVALAGTPREVVSRWIPASRARRLGPPSRFALGAAMAALEDARLPVDNSVSSPVTSVAIGNAFGPASLTEQLLAQIFESPLTASPLLFSECVTNAPAGQVAIAVGARGPNVTIVQRECSGLLACGAGLADLACGRAERALVGCAEETTALQHAVLDRLGARARETPRPFDRRRDGLLVGDGATLLLLEGEATARARGAPIRAAIRGVIRAFDPGAPPWDFGDGSAALGGRLRRGLARLGVRPADLALIVSGASGARRGDRLEAEVLRALFAGEPLPPVMAPKGTVGEYGGAQIAAAVLALEQGRSFPTAGFAEIDPALGLAPVRETAPIDRGPVLVTSLACGGAAAWMVLDPP
ncbi:MAG: beta-ketoacyl synthase N-terminal-like domain-containing protein [Byssovorax sp.]